jgi:3-phenylpropionate/trans-cinnamate dioxygenase ferredoxin reductase subunit
MGRGVGPVVSSFYERLHSEEGVKVRTGVSILSFSEENGALEVV